MLRLLMGILVGTVGSAGAVFGFTHLQKPAGGEAVSRYEQGRNTAVKLGCFSCHGPDGKAGTTNFLPDLDEVPSWARGAFKSYVHNPAEVSEWIVDGMPSRMRKDPQEQERVSKQLIKMPAYKGLVSGEELDALVFYVLSTSTLLPQDEDSAVAKGRAVALRMGCMGCHGGEGRARSPNPGSFKGYIPAWDSADYEELVQSPAEFDQWVLDGAPERLRTNVVARYFMRKQVVQMPAYRKHLEPGELDDLRAYVLFVRAGR